MSDKKQTAVNFAFEKLSRQGLFISKDFKNMVVYYEAKSLEKEIIVEHHTWLLSGVMGEEQARKDAEQYFKETYEQ